MSSSIPGDHRFENFGSLERFERLLHVQEQEQSRAPPDLPIWDPCIEPPKQSIHWVLFFFFPNLMQHYHTSSCLFPISRANIFLMSNLSPHLLSIWSLQALLQEYFACGILSHRQNLRSDRVSQLLQTLKKKEIHGSSKDAFGQASSHRARNVG
jgi:hypothetical protein